MVFAEHYRQEITEANVSIYQRALSGIPAADLEFACGQCLHECEYMPRVADIVKRLTARLQLAQSLESENEWMFALEAAKQFNPDVGSVSPEAKNYNGLRAWAYQPRLSGAGEYAVRCAGGWAALNRSAYDHNDATFRRKTFLEAYSNYSERERLGIADGDAKKILARMGDVKMLKA